MKTLVLLRGLPGSGKSTVAELITNRNVAADDYPGLYTEEGFQPSLLGRAHDWCREIVETWMHYGEELIAVHNTFTTEKEMAPYYFIAEAFGYRIVSLVVENRHGNKSIHGVPDETMKKMGERFQVIL
jgi:predicted kinase